MPTPTLSDLLDSLDAALAGAAAVLDDSPKTALGDLDRKLDECMRHVDEARTMTERLRQAMQPKVGMETC